MARIYTDVGPDTEETGRRTTISEEEHNLVSCGPHIFSKRHHHMFARQLAPHDY